MEILYVPLNYLIQTAYKLESYQLSGPDWMPITRYSIVANMPAGAIPEQMPEMLQSLLAVRFHLVAHRETNQQNICALVIAPGGAKLKEAAPSAPPGQTFSQRTCRAVAHKVDPEAGWPHVDRFPLEGSNALRSSEN